MNINNILTKTEYTKERSAKELFEFVKLKEEELWAWSWEHSGTKALSETTHRELTKGLPDKFAHELTPFAYYANTYYGNKREVRFKPCCGGEPYDGIIIDDNNEVFVEITQSIFGEEWAVVKEVLAEKGRSPWEYDILGVNKKNRGEKKKLAVDIVTGRQVAKQVDCVSKLKELVKKTADKKCKTSLDPSLRYGQNKTILIVTFVEIGSVRPSISKKDWDDFVDFKRTEVDCMKHNFRKIILFGCLDKKFID